MDLFIDIFFVAVKWGPDYKTFEKSGKILFYFNKYEIKISKH